MNARRSPGEVFGRAGAGLDDQAVTGRATWAVNAEVARIGQSGELRTAAILDRFATAPGGPTVLHDLRIPIPGFSANIDHVVVSGQIVWLIDSKVWKPGFYWTWSGTTRRGWERVPHVDKETMRMAHRSVSKLLSGRRLAAQVQQPLVVIWPSSSRTRLSTRFIRMPLSRPVTPQRLEKIIARTVPRPAWLSWLTGNRASPADPHIVAALRELLLAEPAYPGPGRTAMHRSGHR